MLGQTVSRKYATGKGPYEVQHLTKKENERMCWMDEAIWACIQNMPEGVFDAMEPAAVSRMLSQVAGGAGGAVCGAADLTERVARIQANRVLLAGLRKIVSPAQRTEGWYALRRQRLTASEAAKALNCSKFGNAYQLLDSKSDNVLGRPGPAFNSSSPPLKWGTMYEAMGQRTYSQRKGNMVVHEFGMLPHPNVACFGASPDGITELGIMLEIKCPYRRPITEAIPMEYMIQMQGQMAVCGLTECDYIECTIQEFYSEADYYAETDAKADRDHGVILEWSSGPGAAPEYDYSPEWLTPREAYAWAMQNVNGRPGLRLVKARPWKLLRTWIHRVKFIPEFWDNEILPELLAFWDRVNAEATRKKAIEDAGGYDPSTGGADSGNSDSPSPTMAKKKKKQAAKIDFVMDSDEEKPAGKVTAISVTASGRASQTPLACDFMDDSDEN